MAETTKKNLQTGLEIAVIGMAGRFPGARNIEELWNNLKNGVESIVFYTEVELNASGIESDLLNNSNYIRAEGVILEDVDCFDSYFFGYTPSEAEIMDPQVRIFHECSWEALEDAGYASISYDGMIGIYAGASNNPAWEASVALSGKDKVVGEYYSRYLSNKEFLCNWISYKLNLKGPAVEVHTACSTSLVAIHIACRALLTKECDIALAGGINILSSQKSGYLYQEGVIMSSDGHCRAFDAKASGVINGCGAGVAVLKKLKEAVDHGDHIYAVIKSSAINNDGINKVGFAAPGIQGQTDVIKTALHISRVEPESIGYIENHGTGTIIGDPIEIEALKLAFNTQKKGFCAIGSIKTNIGHLDVAAGITGFIKTVLVLNYRLIPPSLHFETPNPKIDFDNSPFFVNTKLMEWKNNEYPLRAGVSSFGIGGTNAHVILEEAPVLKDSMQIADDNKYRLLLLSAKTPSALQRMSQNLVEHLTKSPMINLADMAYTLQQGRQAFQYRRMAVCSDVNGAIEALSAAGSGKFHSAYAKEGKKSPIFMFPGLGSQYVNMGADLYRTEPLFRREMDRCFAILKPLLSYDLKEKLYPTAEISTTDLQHSPGIDHIEIAQLVLFLIEYALAKLIINLGIKPRAMIGYSLGEYTAACLSGVLSLEDALKIIATRGRLIGKLSTGTMLSVPMPAQELIPLLGTELSIAIDNGPSCIAAGPDKLLDDFQKQLKEKRYLCMKLPNSHASHSRMMEPILKEFNEYLGTVTLNKPQIPYISNVTGHWITFQDALDTMYWSRHLTQTVRFADGINLLRKEPNPIFIEIGPGRDLSTLLERYKENDPGLQAVNLIRLAQQDTPDSYYLMRKIGHLWLNGVHIDWNEFCTDEKRCRIPLPTYPFEKHRFWIKGNPFKLVEEMLSGQSLTPGKVKVEFINSLEEEIGAPTQNKRAELSTPYSPPSTKIEQILVDIWEDYFGIKPVGIEDDFFELGGDSLKAITIIAKTFKESRVEVPIGEFFTRPTINKLAEYIIERAGSSTYTKLEPVEEKEYYALSSAQKRLYILQQMVIDSTSYNMPIIIPLAEGVEEEKLESVFKRLIERHESLRTSFMIVNEEPVQKIYREVNFSISYFEIKEKEDILSLISSFTKPFNLNTAPLLRVNLISMGSSRRALFIDMHHIITDGISQGILTNEFLALYSGAEMQPLRLQYKDYSGWHNSVPHQEAIKHQEIYWMKEFPDEIPVLNLPTDYQRPLMQSFEGNRINFEIKEEETQALKAMALSEGSTRFMGLMAIYNILLSKLSGQEDIVIGTPVAGRRHADLEKIIGMFVNTLSLRNYPAGERRFRDFLGDVKERTLMAFENQEYPFEELVDKLSVKRDIGRNPLFDIMFVLQNLNTGLAGQDKETEIGASRSVQLDSPQEYENIFQTAKFDLTLTAMERGRGLFLSFQYCTKLFKKETIERFIVYFKKIVSIAVKEPGIRLREIEIISEEEKKRILFDFNDTQTEYPKDKTINQLFEEQVQRTPDFIAVSGPSLSISLYFNQLSYRKLNENSNRLSHELEVKGVIPDTIIGIMVERFVEMVVGILGILKSGGAYLPIDPEYPIDRIDYMLKDSAAKILVTTVTLAKEVKRGEGKKNLEIILLDSLSSPSFRTSQPPNVHLLPATGCRPPATYLAYIIYTSGTTGKPKGVLVEHRNAANTVNWFIDIHKVRSGIRILQLSDYTFDASVNQIFGPLISGVGLYITAKKMRADIEKLRDYIIYHRINIINFVPIFLKELLCYVDKLESLHTVISGAEKLDEMTKEAIIGKGYRLFNQYGPTETAIDALALECSSEKVSLGKPISNVKVYILDKYGKVLPIGLFGELYIAGDGVARGYLDRPELTAERFIHFSHKLHELYELTRITSTNRIYKTGDLACWLPDGNIEFLGRIDNQVKIRGYRIELGEIENRLLNIEGIKEVVVLARQEDGWDKYICAYFVSDREYGISELREKLSKELPDYMIPSYFVSLEKIPLTGNGKVDRRALPEPELKAGEGYVAPRNEIEKKLTGIWGEVLGRDPATATIGIDDNFFELGGHSLKATILVSKIHKVFDVKVPLVEIFKRPWIRELANYIKENCKEYYISIEPSEKKEYYLLSSAQKRLYILQQMKLDSTAYNMPEIILLSAESDWKKIEETFKKLIKRHESLRTSLHMVSDTPAQVVHDGVEFDLDLHDFKDSHDSQDFIKRFIRPFDLAKPPLIRAGLIKGEDKHHILIVDLHHIISDGVSHGILVIDFLALHEGEELPPLRVQYKDFSEWQKGEKEKENLKRQEEYWLKDFTGEIPVLELPTDYPRPVEQSFEGNSVNFEITEEGTQSLKSMALSQGSTLFIVLLAIYNILLSKLSGQEDVVIGTPIAGRRHTDLEKIIGMFVNTLSLRNYPVGEQRFRDFLGDVKERTLMAFENQEYPFEELVDQLSVKRDIGRNPLFDIMFVLQNMNTGLAGQEKENKIEISRSVRPDSPKEYENIFQTAKFDLTLTVLERGRGLFISFQYCTKLFKEETIERFILYFKKIVTIVVSEPGIKLREIEITSEEEKKRILLDFNDTQKEYPKDKTINQLFEEQMQRTPDFIAVSGPSLSISLYFNQLTYRKLNENSNRLKHELEVKGVRPDTIIGIMVERFVEMIVGILGILKSGGAYLPIDPEYPIDRIDYMLKDSGAKVLVTAEAFVEELEVLISGEGKKNLEIILLDSLSSPSFLTSQPPNLYLLPTTGCRPPATSLAYIIYTSGTAGKPKGVLVEHRNVSNTVNWFIDIHKVGIGIRILQLSDYTFDASVNQIFGPLVSGAGLYITAKKMRADIEKLRDYIIYHRINIINFVPTFLKELLCYVNKLESLHTVISGAEKLDELTKEAIIGKGYRLFNQYGPTETTIDALAIECSSEKVSLGKPISNVKVYILDKYEKALPIGVLGELFIAGTGVARGYLNRPELIAEKFVISPLTTHHSTITNQYFPQGHLLLRAKTQEPRAKFYKTGDLARWLIDGKIEFLGRIDQQVKIRGYRIEPGEIESQLLKCHDICESIVIDRENSEGKKYLCAYFVSEKKIDISELRRILLKTLPDYMIPSYFIQVERIPLTANGKIDRKALNSIVIEMKSEEEYIAPRNEIEEKIMGIWKEVLRLEKVGVSENFFDIGGTSLDIIRLNVKFKAVFNEEETVVQMFRYPTIRSFADFLIQKRDRIVSNNSIYRAVPINKIKQARQNQKTRRLKGGISNG